MEILKHLHINIPLIEVIKLMPNYSKFIKDILRKKGKEEKNHAILDESEVEI